MKTMITILIINKLDLKKPCGYILWDTGVEASRKELARHE